MRSILISALLICGGALAACKKPAPEQVPLPKVEAALAAPAVSTAPAVEQNPLNAPGSYLKTTVGQVQKAKDAKALYEEAAKQNLRGLDLNDNGGN
jgi:hypothetical protein